MKRLIISSCAIATSFLAGFGASSYLQKNLASSISIAAGGGLLSAGVTWFIFDTKITRLRNELQDRIDRNKRKLEVSMNNETKLQAENNSLQLTIEDCAKKVQQLTAEALVTEDKLVIASQLNSEFRAEIYKLQAELIHLKNDLENTIAQRDEFRAEAEVKENEIKDFEETFTEEVQRKGEEVYRTRFDKEAKIREVEQISLLDESEAIIAELNELMDEVYERHQSQREYVLGTNDQFFKLKNRLDVTHQQAIDALREENETLEMTVEQLKRTIDNGLIAPVYREYGKVSLQGKTINHFIEWVWRYLDTPLEGLAYEENEDGVITFGVNYPKQLDPKEICKNILDNANDCCKSLGIHNINRVEYIAKYDAIGISYRHVAPKPESDDDIYKAGLIPASQFADVIFKAIDTKNSASKPTMRVMAATGEGKGIAMKNLLAGLTDKDVEIWLSDPVDGDDFDFWDCPKVARTKKEAGQAYSQFVKTHQQRTGTKNNRLLIAMFDEFDKKHDDDDKLSAKDLMTDIRHSSMVQILIGQAAEVGANKWTWDDMKNCTLLVLGDSIGTLCKHLVKDFGWATAEVNEVKRLKQKFMAWADAKNTPEIPTENAYRIGLLVVGGKYKFVEIPSAYKGIIKPTKAVIKESLTDTINPFRGETTATNPTINSVEKNAQKCPRCHSTSFNKNGAKKNGQQFVCKDCGKSYSEKTAIY